MSTQKFATKALQIIQRLETLPVRVQKHNKKVSAFAQWIEDHEKVACVNYSGLKSSKYYNLVTKCLSKEQSRLLTFGLKRGFEN